MSDLFPTTVVGSFPRPSWLLEAIQRYEKGELTPEELEAYYQDAIKLTVKEQEHIGLDVVSDGEQRRFSFFLAELFQGVEYRPIYELAVKDESKRWLQGLNMPQTVKIPITVGRIGLRSHFAVSELEFLKKITHSSTKTTLPSPYMVVVNSWNSRLTSQHYQTPQELGHDAAKVLNQEIRALRESGAEFVQLDDPSLSNIIDPKYYKLVEMVNEYKPMPPKQELDFAISLINEATRGISGVRIGVHICRGNWPAPEESLPRGGYEAIMRALHEIKVDQLVLEFATQRAGSTEVLREYPEDKEIGLGVIDVKNREVEKPQEVVQRVRRALKYLDPGKIWLNPDCGFASGRQWPVARREAALMKLRAEVEAATILRQEYT